MSVRNLWCAKIGLVIYSVQTDMKYPKGVLKKKIYGRMLVVKLTKKWEDAVDTDGKMLFGSIGGRGRWTKTDEGTC